MISVRSFVYFHRKMKQEKNYWQFLKSFQICFIILVLPEYPKEVCIAIFRNYYLKEHRFAVQAYVWTSVELYEIGPVLEELMISLHTSSKIKENIHNELSKYQISNRE